MTEVSNDIDGMTKEDATELCGNCQRRVAANNFVIHSAHCQRNIELCRLCREPFPTRDMEQHLAEAHSRTSCDKCLQPMEQWQLHAHKETCKKRLTSCQYCLLSLPFDEIPKHEDYCGSRTQSCPECRQFVMKRNEKDHQEMCTKVQCGNRYQGASSNASGSAFSVIRNTFSTPSNAKREANEATSSSVERNKLHDYGYHRNVVQDATNRKGSAWERKALDKEQMGELIEKTKDETCKKRLTSCRYCLLSLPLDEIQEHEKYCGSRAQSCPECRQFVMKRNEKDHQEMCTKVQYGNRYQEASTDASGIRNTFLTPFNAKREANEATSSSGERNKPHDYGYHRNVLPDAANRKGSACERKALDKEQMRELIEKTKDIFVECCMCNSNVLSSEMKNHLDGCRVDQQLKEKQKLNQQLKEEQKMNQQLKEEQKINQQLKEEQKHAAETSSSLYHGYLPSYDEVIGNARWSSPHPSQKSQEQEASKASIQTIMEECPVCLNEFPSLSFSDHLQYCSERQTVCRFCELQVLALEVDNHERSCAAAVRAPSPQQFPSHFDRMYEQCVPSEQSYANIMKNTSKNQMGHESRTGMGQNSPQLCLETESELCPICKSKILSMRFEDHLKCCSERKMKCHFCNQSIFRLDHEDHMKECYSSSRASAAGSTKRKSVVSPSFSDVLKSSLNTSKVNSWSESATSFNLRSDQEHQEPDKRAEPQQCPLCDKETHPADKNHHAQCVKKSYICRYCGVVLLRPKFNEHIDAQCKNLKDFKWKTMSGSRKRGKKNSSKERNYDDFFVKNTDSDSFSSRNFPDHFLRNTDSNKGAFSAKVEPIMLPCEFCEELVPEEEIILHQSGCRPDLVSYTAKSVHENDLYGSNLNPSDEPVRRKFQKWKLDDDSLPGEYIFHPSPDARPIPARNNTSHGSTLKEKFPHKKEIENEHPSPLNRDLPKAENAFNFMHSVAEDKFNPKPLLQHRLKDDNSLERYLEFLNVDSDGESDGKEELNVRGGEQRTDQLGKVAQNSMGSSASAECFNDRFCRESAEISNGNIVEGDNPKFAYHANVRRLSNETSACQKPQEELQLPYQLFGATGANSNQDAKEKAYYEEKDYHGKQ